MDSLKERIHEAAKGWGKSPAPRLSALADYINERFPEFEAQIEPTTYDTDRHFKNSRLRRPGKGRKGNELRVYRRGDNYTTRIVSGPVFRHNAAETYRHNYEVCRWIVEQEKGRTG